MTGQKHPDEPAGTIPVFEEVGRRVFGPPDMTLLGAQRELQVNTLLFIAAFHVVNRDAGRRDVLVEPADGEDQAERILRTGAIDLRDRLLGSAGSWGQVCREELEHAKPDDAEQVAWALLDTAQGWCSGAYTPSAADLRDGAAGLLEDLCPPSWRDAARRVLDRWTGLDEHRPATAEETITAHPGVAAATATAVVAWLYAQPQREPDPVEGLGGLAAAVTWEMQRLLQRDS